MADKHLIDPLQRTITLHDHTWYGHIIKGHPEISSERAEVEEVITNPQEIRFSASDPDCRVYYGATSGGRLLAVVADIVTGVVKTAYPASKKKLGAVEWSR